MKAQMLGASVAAVILAAGPSHGHSGSDDSRLTRGDMDRLAKTENRTLDDQDAQSGTIAYWKNEASGAYGSVTVLQVFRRRGLPCKRLQYVFKIAKSGYPISFAIDYCRVEDGAWNSFP